MIYEVWCRTGFPMGELLYRIRWESGETTVGNNRSSTLTHDKILNSDEGQLRSNIR